MCVMVAKRVAWLRMGITVGCHGCVVGVVTVFVCVSWLRSGVALLRMGVTVA
jgi:hypothetical protein